MNPNCGISWNEERDIPVEDPDTCPHLRVDHRGSSKGQLRTYCKDCGTVIDIADRSAAREVEAEARNPTMTIEEAALLERVINGDNVFKHEILHALNTMTEAVGSLNQGEEYSLKSVADAFLDHIDRAREALRNSQEHRAFPCIKGAEDSSGYLCVECGYEIEEDELGIKNWIRLKDDSYIHTECWSVCPAAFADQLHYSELPYPKGSEPDSDSSGPWPLVESPETSEEEWDRTRRELRRYEAKALTTARQKKIAERQAKQSAKIAKQQKEIASKNKEIEGKLAELNKVPLRLQKPIYGAASSGSDARPKTVAVPAQPENTRVSYAGSNTKLKPDIQATTHRVVDPMTDEGVWVVVDEGANSCCHGDEWRRNAEDKIYKKGFRFDAVHHKATQFKGIGNRSTKGLWNVPLGLKLRDSNDIFQGSCQSHELSNSDFPLLLSQAVQAHLHFVKDMAKRTIMLGDTGEFLEVVRQANTGLFMITD